MLWRDCGIDVSEVHRQHGHPESRFVVDAPCAGISGSRRQDRSGCPANAWSSGRKPRMLASSP